MFMKTIPVKNVERVAFSAVILIDVMNVQMLELIIQMVNVLNVKLIKHKSMNVRIAQNNVKLVSIQMRMDVLNVLMDMKGF